MLLTLFIISTTTLLLIDTIWSQTNLVLLNNSISQNQLFKGNIYRLFKLIALVSFFITQSLLAISVQPTAITDFVRSEVHRFVTMHKWGKCHTIVEYNEERSDDCYNRFKWKGFQSSLER